MGEIESEAVHGVEDLAKKGFRFAAESADGLTWRTRLLVAGLLLAVVAFLAVAFWPAKPVHEDVTPAPMVRVSDHEVVAATAPASQPPAPRAAIPRGAVRERAGRIVATPAPGASSVEVDTELVREGDKRRLLVSSPDGTINSAIDIPIEPALIPPAPKPWAAGLSYDTRHAVGVWLDRDVGRLVVGAALSRLPDGKTEAQVRVGVRF